MTYKDIHVRFVVQDKQRYATLGDYWETTDAMVFTITRLSGLRSLYVLIHELWECYLTLRNGITEESISEFDISHPELDDPGLDPRAPYHAEHMQSDVLERACCVMAGDDWVEYEKECEEIFE